MSRLRKSLFALLFLQILLLPLFSFAEAMREIDEASAAARDLLNRAREAAANPSPTTPVTLSHAEITRLEAALKRGEEINSSLRTQVQQLEAEQAKLVQVQQALTSGLVGALVTAVVAIAGAFVTSRNSRPERDLKRLAVVEKARELQQAGIQLPTDIAENYAALNNKG